MWHAVDHAMCGFAVYRAGFELDKRRRAIWLTVAGIAFVRCHLHHHRKT